MPIFNLSLAISLFLLGNLLETFRVQSNAGMSDWEFRLNLAIDCCRGVYCLHNLGIFSSNFNSCFFCCHLSCSTVSYQRVVHNLISRAITSCSHFNCSEILHTMYKLTKAGNMLILSLCFDQCVFWS